MAKKDKEGLWLDAQGDAIPARHIKKYDKIKDKLVEDLFKPARSLNAALIRLKETAFEDIEQFFISAEKLYGMNVRTEGGNKTLMNFSGNLKIEMKVCNFVELDERLQMAKAIIDDCLKRWSTGGDEKIRIFVMKAFKVDKKGRVDNQRILDLKNIEIKDDEWKRAMELIKDSQKIVARKTYIKFWERNDAGVWESIPLDFARV